MLNSILHNFYFIKNTKTGLFIDYCFKKITQKFISNTLIWTSLFVSEKFLLEYTTRGLANSIFHVFKKNKKIFDISMVLYFFILISFYLFVCL